MLPNGTLVANIDPDKKNPLTSGFVISTVVYCGDLSTNAAQVCMELVFNTLCQTLCHRENVTRFPWGYDPMIFPKSRCEEIDLKCGHFSDSKCFFSPVSREMQSLKLGSCFGGAYTFGAPVNTEPGFPFVKGNLSYITTILSKLVTQAGYSLSSWNISTASPSVEVIAVDRANFELVNRETSIVVGKKPWWYYFVIVLIVSLIIGASIYAALIYKKKFHDKAEAEELIVY
jgi:hypothetical protein